jgi:hypothetical protein
MKNLLIAFLTLLGMSFIAPDAEARNRDHHRHGSHYTSYSYHHYPRHYYGYRRHYYRPARYYYYDDYYPRYYYRRPAVSVRFSL